MLVADEALLRLVMAELIRQRLTEVGDEAAGRRVVRVTGWRERERVRYPGTSSEWTEHYVDIFVVNADDEPFDYEWRGTFTELTAALEQVIAEY